MIITRNPDGTLSRETERLCITKSLYRVSHHRAANRWELLFYDEHGEILGEVHFQRESQARHYVAQLRKKPNADDRSKDLFPLN